MPLATLKNRIFYTFLPVQPPDFNWKMQETLKQHKILYISSPVVLCFFGVSCLLCSQMTLPMLDTANALAAVEAAAGKAGTWRDLSLTESQ